MRSTKNMTETFKLPHGKRAVICSTSAIPIYAGLNAICVLMPFIPGPAAFIGWGFILPLLCIIGTWILMTKSRQSIKRWWIVGIISTSLYLAMGFMTLYIISAMWAAV